MQFDKVSDILSTIGKALQTHYQILINNNKNILILQCCNENSGCTRVA